MDRCVKIYPVSEHELTTVGTLTFASSFCVGIGSLAIGGALAVLIDVIQRDATAKTSNATWCLFGVLVGLALLFYIAAGLCTHRRTSEWNKIKSEAVEESVGSSSAAAPH